MSDPSLTDRPLDEVAALAGAGDQRATAALLESLRVRFQVIAKRRVRRDDWEDVVQDALRIVLTRHMKRDRQQGILTWSMTVLRNVIGNYYQKRERHRRGESFDERLHADRGGITGGAGGMPGEAAAALEHVLRAVARLEEHDPRCGAIFRRILECQEEGGSPRQISQRAMGKLCAELGGLSRSALYVALHRCRKQLRQILQGLEPAGAGNRGR